MGTIFLTFVVLALGGGSNGGPFSGDDTSFIRMFILILILLAAIGRLKKWFFRESSGMESWDWSQRVMAGAAR